jgi:phosphatidylinositol alpha-1,6-mannosyltransferase
VRRALDETGAEVVLFGASYPLRACWGPGLPGPAPRTWPPRTAFEYWLSIAPGTHALMRRATSLASRVPVMCSEFIARRVRTAVPEARAGLGAVSGRRPRGLPPGPADGRPARAPRVGDRPLVVCVSRLVARKGQDVLILAMRADPAPRARGRRC